MYCGTLLQAQNKLVFLNPAQGKVITAKPGDYIILKYQGYLNKPEFYKNNLLFVTDSSVFLGNRNPFYTNPHRELNSDLGYKEILLKDVTAFKRRSVGAHLGKAMLGVGAAVASIYVLDRLYENRDFSAIGNIALSVGVGLTINLTLNQIFSDKPKNKMKDGWYIESVK